MYVIQHSAGRAGKVAGALVAIVLAAPALAGCGGGSPGSSGASGGGSGQDGGSGSGQAGAFPRTIEHAMGRTTIEEQPRRVVSLDRTFTDATLTLNTEVIGFTTFTAGVSKLPPYLRKAGGENLSDAQPVGLLSEPNLEKIARLKPDLILSAKVRHQAIYDELSKIAPTVFSQTTGTWKSNLKLVGRALGKKQMADQKLRSYDQRAQAIGDAIRAKRGRTTATLVRFAGEPTVRLYTRNSYPGEVIYNDVGLTRPKDAPTSETIKVDISPERILDLDAEHIFVATYTGGSSNKAVNVRKQFQRNPLWSKLKGEIHTVNDTTWFTAVGLQGAQAMLGDLTRIFSVNPSGSS